MILELPKVLERLKLMEQINHINMHINITSVKKNQAEVLPRDDVLGSQPQGLTVIRFAGQLTLGRVDHF